MIKLIKFLLKRYLKRHPEWIASSISVDEQTDINILVAHYYADHWTYGTKTYEYKEKPLGEWKEDAFNIICPFCGMTIDDEVRYLYPDNFDLNFCPNCGKKLSWKGEEYGRD